MGGGADAERGRSARPKWGEKRALSKFPLFFSLFLARRVVARAVRRGGRGRCNTKTTLRIALRPASTLTLRYFLIEFQILSRSPWNLGASSTGARSSRESCESRVILLYGAIQNQLHPSEPGYQTGSMTTLGGQRIKNTSEGSCTWITTRDLDAGRAETEFRGQGEGTPSVLLHS